MVQTTIATAQPSAEEIHSKCVSPAETRPLAHFERMVKAFWLAFSVSLAV